MNVKEIRRENLRLLAHQVGGVAEIARRLEKSTSQISHLIGPHPIKNIGDRIAADIERRFEKPIGWMDCIQRGLSASLETDRTTESLPALVTMVPLLSWQTAQAWPKIAAQENNAPCLPVLSAYASAQAFALLIENDVMESSQSISFPQGCFIIVDPLREVSPHQYVLVRSQRQGQLLFRQLVLDGGRSYLKPLNPRYPITAFPNDGEYLGVVTQLQMDVGMAP
jgi:SOS-response transcriptional repressor LexA